MWIRIGQNKTDVIHTSNIKYTNVSFITAYNMEVDPVGMTRNPLYMVPMPDTSPMPFQIENATRRYAYNYLYNQPQLIDYVSLINKSIISLGYYYGSRTTTSNDVILRSYLDYSNVPSMSDHFGHTTGFISDFGNNGNYIEAQAVAAPTNDSFSVAFGTSIFTMV